MKSSAKTTPPTQCFRLPLKGGGLRGSFGFTLVELLVVISILAILAVIAFLSFNGFASSARDSTRVTDINSITKAFELFKVKGGNYPTPSIPTQDIVYSGGTVWTQGKLGDSVIQVFGNQISKKPTDPSTNSEYDYSLTSLTQEYQIKANFEKTIAYNILPLPLGEGWGEGRAQAASTQVNIYLKGNYNEIFTKTQTGNTLYYIATPSLFINSGSLNLTSTGYYLINKLSYDSTNSSTDGIAFMPQLIYSSTGAPSTDSQFLAFATNLKSIYTTYSGTLISNNQGINTLLTTPDTDTGALTNLAKAVVSLKPISSPTTDNQIQTFTCSGTAPTPATGLIQSITAPTDNTTNWTYSATTSITGPACTWKCDIGYTQNGNTCTAQIYVDDVFSAYTYTGNGGTQTINNGIDLAGKGGMVWEKMRNGGGFADHYLVDSARPSNDVLRTNSTAIPSSPWGGYSFSNNGYTSGLYWNSPATVASWTFRKAPKFFDVVTYTGNGVIGRQIPHNLGVAPGMIIVKQTSGAGGAWRVYHRGTDATAPQDYIMQLQDTASRATSSAWSNTAPTNSVFTVNGAGGTNADTETYVAYIFAHDTSTDGIIQCGSFTTDASGNASVNLGWEPQYVIWKRSDGVGDWFVQDNMRGVAVTDSTYKSLSANTSGTEQNITMVFNSTGFKTPANYTSANAIYCAIRRPNKPPTSGTQMYNAISRATTSSDDIISGVGFPPDLLIFKNRGSATMNGGRVDRLRGISSRLTIDVDIEKTNSIAIKSINMDGVSLIGQGTTNDSSINYNLGTQEMNYFFRRAPGVFDVVAYTATANPNRRISHGMGVVPELIINKQRSVGSGWQTYSASLGRSAFLSLNSTVAVNTSFTNIWGISDPTTMDFGVDETNLLTNGATQISYLFATKANISKVGSYTGNGGVSGTAGTSQTIDAGFSGDVQGAKFILIKRTDVAGDWYIWDSVRGIVPGNDPHLNLNSNFSEVTSDDSIDPDSGGFVVNQKSATNINVTGGTYIYLAIH